MRRRVPLPVLALSVPLLLVAAACAPADEETSSSGGSGSSASPSGSDCSVDNLNLYKDGQLTVATDSPAYDPWFKNNDPTNGKGYESAVTYAVADQLGFSQDQVKWVKVRFNNSYKPGPKDFDFDINQISITPERAKAVDFSDGYYTQTQALIALKDSPAADATSVDDLKSLKLGAQTGTTSLTALRDQVQPDSEPLVFQDTNAAKQALLNGQVDAIVADFYTANYITAVEIPQATIVGQFEQEGGNPEEFGMLFEKGNPLVGCVNEALGTLTSDGTLDQLQQKWLSGATDVPVLK
jgi:polar amino acid transport system substrate-binding protein